MLERIFVIKLLISRLFIVKCIWRFFYKCKKKISVNVLMIVWRKVCFLKRNNEISSKGKLKSSEVIEGVNLKRLCKSKVILVILLFVSLDGILMFVIVNL